MVSKLKIARLQAGRTKACEFANVIGISKQYLSNLENGRARNPNKEIMSKISKELGVSVQDLFFE